jgi:hypothetical protein
VTEKITPRSKMPRRQMSAIPKVGERRSLLAAISILGVSLGVTAAEPASRIAPTKADSTQDSRAKIAQSEVFQSNQLKMKSPTLRSNQNKDKSKSSDLQTNQAKHKSLTLQSNQNKDKWKSPALQSNQQKPKSLTLQSDQMKMKSPTLESQQMKMKSPNLR